MEIEIEGLRVLLIDAQRGNTVPPDAPLEQLPAQTGPPHVWGEEEHLQPGAVDAHKSHGDALIGEGYHQHRDLGQSEDFFQVMLGRKLYDFITKNGTPATIEINENSEFIAFSSLTFGSVPTSDNSSTTSSNDGTDTKTTITFATARESEKESYYGNGDLLKKTTTVETKPSGEASFVPSGESTVYYDYAATITGKKGTEFRVILIVNQMVLENINNTLDDDKKLDDTYLGSFYLEQVND